MIQTSESSNRGWIIARDTVIAGAVYAALLITAYALVRSPLSIMDVLGLLLVATVGYGVAVVVPIAILLKRRRENYGAATLGAVLMGAGGLVGGIMVAVLLTYLQLPRGSWTQLPTPPEQAVEIVGNDTELAKGEAVYVRTASDALYILECSAVSECDWVAIAAIPAETEDINIGCFAEEKPRYQPPLKLGDVQDSQIGALCGADYLVQTNYLLMSDGSLWRWDFFSGMVILVEWFFIIGLGLVFGVLLVLVFIVRPAT